MKPNKQRRSAVMSVRLPDDLKDKVGLIAASRGSDESDVVREALIVFVNGHPGTRKPEVEPQPA